jgi:hypothetical protein
MFATGITAPLESLTTPEIVAVGSCAKAGEPARRKMEMKTKLKNLYAGALPWFFTPHLHLT